MTSPLDQATALLAGDLSIRVHSVRAAAWLTRVSLEDALKDLVHAKGVQPGDASTQTLLRCIEVLYEQDPTHVAASANYGWDVLSQASHHHAYEFPPTHSEVAALTELVKQIIASAEQQSAN